MNDTIVSQISALGRTVSKLVADAAVLQAQYDALVREVNIQSRRESAIRAAVPPGGMILCDKHMVPLQACHPPLPAGSRSGW